eukprot:15271997-Alexandrium_andersonii.AAC.1
MLQLAPATPLNAETRLLTLVMPSRKPMPPASRSFHCGSTPSHNCSTARLRTSCSPDRHTETPAKCAI